RRAQRVVVATDSEEIKRVVEAEGFEAMMTNPDHPTGTDRVAEVSARLGAKRVVNVQGDEPFIDAGLIDGLFMLLENNPDIPMATAVHPHSSVAGLERNSQVKVVVNRAGEALYFSRSLIPCDRDGGGEKWLRHIGIYAYQAAFLPIFCGLPQGELELREKLEQLRALEHGHRIRVIETHYEGFSVDTPEDYAEFLSRLSS
ncbi:MAG: 3-deoxy-manno-octulosonate cytidylyltransferase, partial [Planctomycetota bacterium]